MVLPLLMGRGVSPIRTPILIRDYLTGPGAFADDPPEELAQRLVDGAYVAQIHQRIKQYIKQYTRETRRTYQWPRRHSFQARINDLLMLGLLVETGTRAEPEHRGAGRLGTARGFSERVWVRLAPEAATRPEWADPLGYLIRLKQQQDPSSYQNIRVTGAVLATVALPRPRRRRRQRLVETAVERLAEPLVEAPEGLEELDRERQALRTDAESVAERGLTVNDFEGLRRVVQEFNTRITRVYGQAPFPDLAEALETLGTCMAGLEEQRQLTQQRVQAAEQAPGIAEGAAPGVGLRDYLICNNQSPNRRRSVFTTVSWEEGGTGRSPAGIFGRLNLLSGAGSILGDCHCAVSGASWGVLGESQVSPSRC
jgi:hypothetical protein